MKRVAPRFYDAVFDKILGAILKQLPNSLASDPKILAKFFGQMLVALGKIALERDPSALIELSKPIIKELLKAAKAGVEYGGIAALKAVPGAVKSVEAKASLDSIRAGLLAEMQKAGMTLAPSDADAIVSEIAANPKEVLALLQQFESAFSGLTVD
uniref:hypothetical protein n=1 Tax=uncultured Rhizobium sp. TaxID=155567 RepID=UPI0026154FB2|nr:hypothetical protein [uncultured Rhizobium sp.]